MPRRSDRLLLQDILEALGDIEAFTTGMTHEAFAADRRTIHAVCRCLEIVGEAASRLSPTMIARMPGPPWNALRGLRNRIVHAYFAVDTEIVHRICTEDLGQLKAAIMATLDQEP